MGSSRFWRSFRHHQNSFEEKNCLMRKLSLTITFTFFLALVGITPSHAITEGANCNSAKFGNSLVMSNGKIHGGLAGPNKNYSGPLYLCMDGVWVYWRMAEPPSSSSKTTLNVKPGQACNKYGRVVESTNYGSLSCAYVKVGKIRALLWVQN